MCVTFGAAGFAAQRIVGRLLISDAYFAFGQKMFDYAIHYASGGVQTSLGRMVLPSIRNFIAIR